MSEGQGHMHWNLSPSLRPLHGFIYQGKMLDFGLNDSNLVLEPTIHNLLGLYQIDMIHVRLLLGF